MARMVPDTTFYPSPGMAMKAPPEAIAYVAMLNPNGGPDSLTAIDVKPLEAVLIECCFITGPLLVALVAAALSPAAAVATSAAAATLGALVLAGVPMGRDTSPHPDRPTHLRIPSLRCRLRRLQPAHGRERYDAGSAIHRRQSSRSCWCPLDDWRPPEASDAPGLGWCLPARGPHRKLSHARARTYCRRSSGATATAGRRSAQRRSSRRCAEWLPA